MSSPLTVTEPTTFNADSQDIRDYWTQAAKTSYFSIIDFLDLIPSFRPSDDWASWRVFLKATFGIPITTKEELDLYQYCTKRELPPDAQVRETWMAVGQRAGKGRIGSLIATYMAVCRDYSPNLAPGQRIMIPIIAVGKNQAAEMARYIGGFFKHHAFAPLLTKGPTADGRIELWNDVTIQVFAGSFRSIRGFTVPTAIFDEIAFWKAEDSATPDTYIVDAVRAATLNIDSPLLVGLSSPWGRRGVLWNTYDRYFGKPNADVLVWNAPTQIMRPTLSPADADLISRKYAEDPVMAAAIWGAKFRTDIREFIPNEQIKLTVIPNRIDPLPHSSKYHYHAFVDPSGGTSDSMVLSIAHWDGSKVVIDCLSEWAPDEDGPFSPKTATAEASALLHSYFIRSVWGDNYAGEYPKEEFRHNSIQYIVYPDNKSKLYISAIPLFTSWTPEAPTIELPDNPRLLNQFDTLERRTGASGRDIVDHKPNCHDDLCFPAGTLIATTRGNTPIEKVVVGDTVLVPGGTSKVTESKQTGVRPVISRFGITATPNHPIYVRGEGFIPLNEISGTIPPSAFDRLSLGGMLKWSFLKEFQQSSSSKERSFDSWVRGSTTSANQQPMPGEGSQRGFMSRSGRMLTVQAFFQVMKSIISTATHLTTILLIWSVFRGLSIVHSLNRMVERLVSNIFGIVKTSATLGIALLKGGLGIENTQSNPRSESRRFARFVGVATSPVSLAQGFVLVNASSALVTKEPRSTLSSSALGVEHPSRHRNNEEKTGPRPVEMSVQESSEETPVPVFNLTTEAGVYYANGVLAHNCNSLIGSAMLAWARQRLGTKPTPSTPMTTTNEIVSAMIGASLQKSITAWDNRVKSRNPKNPYNMSKRIRGY